MGRYVSAPFAETDNAPAPSGLVTVTTVGSPPLAETTSARCTLLAAHEPVTTRTATVPAASVSAAACASAAAVCEHTSIALVQVVEAKSAKASAAHASHCVWSHVHVAPVASDAHARPWVAATASESTAAALRARISWSSASLEERYELRLAASA